MSLRDNVNVVVLLLMFRSLFNVILTFVLASILPSDKASMILFVFMLATQVRGVSELNLSNFCVLRLQDGVNIRNFSIWLLLWQFLVVLAALAVCSTFFNVIVLDALAYSLVFFVICNQGLWGLVYTYGSADGNFERHLFSHGSFLASAVLGLHLYPMFAIQFFLAFGLLSLGYFFWVVFGFDNSNSTSTPLTIQVVSYIKPFAINNLSALFFVLLTMPLVVKILPSNEYVLYTLAIQVSGIFLFLYRGVSKNILASLYARKSKNEGEEKLIVLILAIAGFLFLLSSLDLQFFSQLSVNLRDLSLNLEFLMLASGLGLMTLINLHQNNCLQAIDKNWPLLGFRVFSSSVLVVSLWLLYRLADEPVFRTILAIDYLVVLTVVILTRVYLTRYWRSIL
jgi:hypothetical protein